MESLILFFGILLAFVVLAKIVNLIRGVKASYIDSFQLDSGEQILFEEKQADFMRFLDLDKQKSCPLLA